MQNIVAIFVDINVFLFLNLNECHYNNSINIFVWCVFSLIAQVDFGEVFIPVGLDVPKPRVLPEFKRLAHGLRSSNISVLDAKTFYIPNLHYDGAGPDAYFWVGNGSEPNIMGIKVIISANNNDLPLPNSCHLNYKKQLGYKVMGLLS